MAMLAIAPQLSVRLTAPRLDARLAGGEWPLGSAALALRAAQLASRRWRRQLAAGLAHAWSRHGAAALSSAVPADAAAVEIALPALEQLAQALVSRERVGIRGVALTQLLLTEPTSPLYGSRYPEELYERVREALLAL